MSHKSGSVVEKRPEKSDHFINEWKCLSLNETGQLRVRIISLKSRDACRNMYQAGASLLGFKTFNIFILKMFFKNIPLGSLTGHSPCLSLWFRQSFSLRISDNTFLFYVTKIKITSWLVKKIFGQDRNAHSKEVKLLKFFSS